MFKSILDAEFSYQFEKIRNAISNRSTSSVYAATSLGISIIKESIVTFKEELEGSNIADFSYDIDNYLHALNSMDLYYNNNPNKLTEMDAWIYYHYIKSKFEGFKELAQEVINDK